MSKLEHPHIDSYELHRDGLLIGTNLVLDPVSPGYDEAALRDLEQAVLTWAKEHNIGTLQIVSNDVANLAGNKDLRGRRR